MAHLVHYAKNMASSTKAEVHHIVISKESSYDHR